MERGEFVVHYQPIAWLATGGVAGFEASLRWEHPERGLLPPGEFLPLAQRNGLGHDLDRLLLAEACGRTALWRASFPEHFPPTIGVGLSADALSRDDLAGEIGRALEESGLPAHALMVGFSEEAIAESPENVAALRRLKALGVRLAVDDFGTGRSSLEFLHRLPADTLKIAPSFVRRVGSAGGTGAEPEDRAEVAQTVLTVAHKFGMEVLAEGVQTREQVQALRQMDCDYALGPRFSRPVGAERAEAILAAEPAW